MYRLAVTPGEPAGIGPDVLIKAAQRNCAAQLIALADPDLLAARAELLKLPLSIHLWQPGDPFEPHQPEHLWIKPTSVAAEVTPGQLDNNNANYVIETLDQAAEGCIDGTFDALVTAPVQKSIINDAGIDFSGHTEFFQAKAGISKVVMMLASPTLRVALTTTHLPLREVPEAVSADNLSQTIEILHQDLVLKFGIDNPHILIAGLNPHAGEGGYLGREEIDVMQPVINEYRNKGMSLEGPLPADTLFTEKYLVKADAVLAMYHDQGLPVLKSQGFGESVNITLGLPFVRTSVDHGTALDLAGTGLADEQSLQTAIDMAESMLHSLAKKANCQ